MRRPINKGEEGGVERKITAKNITLGTVKRDEVILK